MHEKGKLSSSCSAPIDTDGVEAESSLSERGSRRPIELHDQPQSSSMAPAQRPHAAQVQQKRQPNGEESSQVITDEALIKTLTEDEVESNDEDEEKMEEGGCEEDAALSQVREHHVQSTTSRQQPILGAQAVYPSSRRATAPRSSREDGQEGSVGMLSSDLLTTVAPPITTAHNNNAPDTEIQIEITEAQNVPQTMVDELNETQQVNRQLTEQLRALQEQTSNVVVASAVGVSIHDNERQGQGQEKGKSKMGEAPTIGRFAFVVVAVGIVLAVIIGASVAITAANKNKKNSTPSNTPTEDPVGPVSPQSPSELSDVSLSTLQRIHDRGYLRCSSFDFAFIDDLVRYLCLPLLFVDLLHTRSYRVTRAHSRQGD